MEVQCLSQGGFFEASADCDELECDVAWLVTALQRVAHFGVSMNRYATQLVQVDQSLLTRIVQQENTLISIARVECHANKYLVCSSSPIQIRLHALCPFHMNTIDDESPEAYTTTRIIPVAKHATFQIPSSGKSKRQRNADVLSCFLADERTSADNQAVSTSPPARRRRRKVFSFLAYNLTLVISGTNREGKTGAQASQ
ncbi:hypothetical protein PCH_Pc22g26770 [Penicillium rubens Wisconsin 54-1255]|uniref:Uncharacterized protein n=1 Tax=Penicillium rubens (strain ATCC 28089 / DSM 1075 / NRRL 1951 / Wisconsin 54-1255) TaxID=500485 RepID=B6HUB4_PENRW|nr:hypothetical protein PCH_Pc22g26770 [Penicillium rubens Wisconsin 54-1255]